MSVALPPEVVRTVQAALHAANATRYLSAVGLVLLIYDHVLTFPEEIEFIWKAPSSFARNAFLLNRYVVLANLLVVAIELCGFSGIEFNNSGCRALITSSALIGICSIGMASALMLLQVVVLWDGDRMVARLMSCGFAISFCATIATMVTSLAHLFTKIEFSTIANTCVVTAASGTLIAVWASPLIFELLVLCATCWNALQRPRTADVGLTKSLYRDGITFYFCLILLRTVNLAFASTMNPDYTMLSTFFVWSMTTLVLNRSLLRIRHAQVTDMLLQSLYEDPRTASPFGGRPKSHPTSPSTNKWIQYVEDDLPLQTFDHHEMRVYGESVVVQNKSQWPHRKSNGDRMSVAKGTL